MNCQKILTFGAVGQRTIDAASFAELFFGSQTIYRETLA